MNPHEPFVVHLEGKVLGSSDSAVSASELQPATANRLLILSFEFWDSEFQRWRRGTHFLEFFRIKNSVQRMHSERLQSLESEHAFNVHVQFKKKKSSPN